MAQLVSRLKNWASRLKQSLIVLSLAAKHPDTSIFAKYWIFFIIAYAISPIDLIPDFIPIIGYLDDLILLPAGIWVAIKLIPEDVWTYCKQQARQDTHLPKNHYVGIIIIAIWCLIAVLIVVFIT